MRAIAAGMVTLILLTGCSRNNPVSIPVPRSQFHSKISFLSEGMLEYNISWKSGEGYIAVDNVVFDTPKGKISLYSYYGDTAWAGGRDFVGVVPYGDTLDRGSYQLWASGHPYDKTWDFHYYSDTSSATW